MGAGAGPGASQGAYTDVAPNEEDTLLPTSSGGARRASSTKHTIYATLASPPVAAGRGPLRVAARASRFAVAAPRFYCLAPTIRLRGRPDVNLDSFVNPIFAIIWKKSWR